jgi:DNA-binding Xre family transcriptional regulator
MKTEEILAERATTHGDFSDNARISQALKGILSEGHYTDLQQEALDMICLKLSRIVCNPNVKDHWDDIAGYAKLAADRL